MKKALLVVDPLNDFITGSLAVPNAIEIIPHINKLVDNKNFDVIVFLQDWHPEDHIGFISQHPNKEIFDVIDVDGIEQVL